MARPIVLFLDQFGYSGDAGKLLLTQCLQTVL